MSGAYLNFSGWVTLPRPPFNCLGADFYAFGFPADQTALQGYLDKTYNAIAGRKKFQVLLDVVFFLCVKNTAIVATTPPFSEQGGTPEIDVGFWVLVGSFKDGETWPLALPSEVAWAPAYLFVDNGLAVSVGREIMGYPKYLANITMAPGSPSHGPFVASALLTRTFTPSAIASQQQFLSLHGTSIVATGTESPTGAARTPVEVFARLSARARPDLLKPLESGQLGTNFLPAPNIPVPVWYLKQSRSADGSDVAIYQQILEGPLTLTTLRNVKFLSGRWTLELVASTVCRSLRNSASASRAGQAQPDDRPRDLGELRLHVGNGVPDQLSRPVGRLERLLPGFPLPRSRDRLKAGCGRRPSPTRSIARRPRRLDSQGPRRRSVPTAVVAGPAARTFRRT